MPRGVYPRKSGIPAMQVLIEREKKLRKQISSLSHELASLRKAMQLLRDYKLSSRKIG